jgi:hypothetical protein
MPSQDFDFARRNDYLNELRAGVIEQKQSLREKIEIALAEFEASGGSINEIPSNPRVPRQPCPNPEPYPKRKNPKPFEHYKYNTVLRDWLCAVEGRASKLAIESNYSEPWISGRRHGFFQLLLIDYEVLKKCMDKIEKFENETKLRELAEKYAGDKNDHKN